MTGIAGDNAANLTHPKYRPDIDGLRAIGVLSVVAYHAFAGQLRSGFIGVDVFFVISGFLISTIILENLGQGSFSFLTFYRRRVKRIFPALLLVLAATLVFGVCVLMPYDIASLGKDVAAGVGFVSNLRLWGQSGYFDVAAVQKPLLHLWSLGIEEQFYIFWPLLLWATWTRQFRGLFLIAAVGLGSFLFNLWEAGHDPVADFYSPLTRFFELSIGSLLAYLNLRHAAWLVRATAYEGNIVSFAGAALLTAGFVVIRPGQGYPGWWALLPTLGTVLMIAAGPQAWLNRILLANRFLVWFGLISYPLYLWHWPLLSFAKLVYPGDLPRVLRGGLVLAAIGLAWLTYAFVEKPVRFGRHTRLLTGAVFIAMVVTGFLGFFVTALLPYMYGERGAVIRQLTAVKAMHDHMVDLYGPRPCFKYRQEQTVTMFLDNGCVSVRRPGSPVVMLIGDSFSASLSLGLRPLVEGRGLNFLQVSTGYCEPTSNDASDTVCRDINAMVLRRIAALKPDLVIFNSNWNGASVPSYFNGGGNYDLALLEYLKRLQALGAKQIIVAGQVPTWNRALPDVLMRSYVMRDRPIPERTFEGVLPESLAMDARMAKIPYPNGVRYVSLKAALCDQQGCLTRIGPDLSKDLVVWDYGHLTPATAKLLAGRFFEKLLPSPK